MTPKKLQIIELDKADIKPLGSPKEVHSSILSLQGHQGFEELLRRARVAKSIFEARLRKPEEDENRHYLRALIEAYGFMERQLKQEVGKQIEQPREAFEEERREYERLAQFVEFVGRGSGEAN